MELERYIMIFKKLHNYCLGGLPVSEDESISSNDI